MITYSLWLYEIDTRNLANFVSAFSENGLLYESFRRMPGHIHTDLLKGADTVSSTNRLLSISFFTSVEDCFHSERSTQMRVITRWLQDRTNRCFQLVIFSMVPKPQREFPSETTPNQPSTPFTPGELSR